MKDLLAVQLELEAEMHGAGILRFTKNNQRSIDSGAASEADWFRRQHGGTRISQAAHRRARADTAAGWTGDIRLSG